MMLTGDSCEITINEYANAVCIMKVLCNPTLLVLVTKIRAWRIKPSIICPIIYDIHYKIRLMYLPLFSHHYIVRFIFQNINI